MNMAAHTIKVRDNTFYEMLSHDHARMLENFRNLKMSHLKFFLLCNSLDKYYQDEHHFTKHVKSGPSKITLHFYIGSTMGGWVMKCTFGKIALAMDIIATKPAQLFFSGLVSTEKPKSIHNRHSSYVWLFDLLTTEIFILTPFLILQCTLVAFWIHKGVQLWSFFGGENLAITDASEDTSSS